LGKGNIVCPRSDFKTAYCCHPKDFSCPRNEAKFCSDDNISEKNTPEINLCPFGDFCGT